MGKILTSASHFNILCKEARAILEAEGHEVIYDPSREFPSYSEKELIEILPDIDGALIGLDVFNETVFNAAPKLKVVAKFGVGVDNIDIDSASRHGVKVVNAPGMNSNAVAELTVGMILGVLRKIIPLHENMTHGRWLRYVGTELGGKTIGLVGFGAIARLVAKKLKSFDVSVLAYDLYPNQVIAEELGVKLVSFDEIIKESDIISLHIPPSKKTIHLFNKDIFSRMRDGSYLINAARGALVDLDDLSDALISGHIAGAALDAFEVEPLPKDAAILKCENIILTPHTGAETAESYRRVSVSCCKDICAIINGKEAVHCLN